MAEEDTFFYQYIFVNESRLFAFPRCINLSYLKVCRKYLFLNKDTNRSEFDLS